MKESGEEVVRIVSARKAFGRDKDGYERARAELDIQNDKH